MFFEVSDLSVSRGPIRVLRGVSLTVQEKEIVSLIGANGAGKTTLLFSLVGLLRAQAGRVTLLGNDLTGLKPDQVLRAGVALCPAERHVFSDMTVLENLRLGAVTRGDRAGIERDLDRMFSYFPRLRERRAQKGGTLSGGEQQMLAMARAVMGSPRLLLLDEPSLGLAPIIIEEVGRLIGDLNDGGTAILLVEQNAMLALKVSRQTYVLELGRIVLAGVSRDLASQDAVRKAFLGE